MGLGKTIQALAGLPAKKKTLVVCPKSVLFNWMAEIAKFRPDLVVSMYAGTRRALDTSADLVLTSYPILRNDIEAIALVAWDIVILDESQTIKNPDSQVARAAYKLKAGWKLTLSGTPVENRLDELWSQLHFTNPGLLGGRGDFLERWADPIGLGDRAAAARLRERIRPFVLRRLKKDVAKELPPRTDAIMYVELEENERVTYDAIRAATQKEIVRMLEAGGGVMQALEALLRLRQAACHTALLPGGLRTGPAPQTSSKLERLMEALSDAVAEGHRALVFSQWTSLLDLIEPHLDEANTKFVRLDGSTTDRAAVVNEFQAEDGPPVMLLSLKAGGTGLNLTAADHVFLIDPWWNPAVEDQAADRAHRIGQDKPVMVYRMVARRYRRGAHPRAAGEEARPRRCGAVRGGWRARDHARRPASLARVKLHDPRGRRLLGQRREAQDLPEHVAGRRIDRGIDEQARHRGVAQAIEHLARDQVAEIQSDREQLFAGAHLLREVFCGRPGREQKPVRPPTPHVLSVRGEVPDPRRQQLDQILHRDVFVRHARTLALKMLPICRDSSTWCPSQCPTISTAQRLYDLGQRYGEGAPARRVPHLFARQMGLRTWRDRGRLFRDQRRLRARVHDRRRGRWRWPRLVLRRTDVLRRDARHDRLWRHAPDIDSREHRRDHRIDHRHRHGRADHRPGVLEVFARDPLASHSPKTRWSVRTRASRA